MYRYRYERGLSDPIDNPNSTYQAKPLQKLAKLGELKSIKAYRYRAKYHSSEGIPYFAEVERILVRGTKGTARFSGVCWNYFGSGPHATEKLLLACNVPVDTAKKLAFYTPRLQKVGTDWEYNFPERKFNESGSL